MQDAAKVAARGDEAVLGLRGTAVGMSAGAARRRGHTTAALPSWVAHIAPLVLTSLLAAFVSLPMPQSATLVAGADTGPGTIASLTADESEGHVTFEPVAVQSLEGRRDTFTGNVGYTADGMGQNGARGGVLRADVPPGAEVLQATLYGTYFGGVPSASRIIDVDGRFVSLTLLPQTNSFLDTALADVTDFVTAKPADLDGLRRFRIGNDPSNLDGLALLVVFSHPSLPNASIAIKEGSANQSGDVTQFAFTKPLDKGTAGFSATLSLGIGFGFQGEAGHRCGASSSQYSLVDVNGQRLTSCAGGSDDGYLGNGGLITVGGVSDSIDNPSDAFQQGGDGRRPRVDDDELYDLAPFVETGDTALNVFSRNPSFDDNLFLKVVKITGRTVPGFYVNDADESFGYRDTSGYAGDPVNTASGNFVTEAQDLTTSERILGLRLPRTFNSLDSRDGTFGRGWTSPLDESLDVTDPAMVVHRAADGRVVRYVRDSSGYRRPPGAREDLTRLPAGGWALAGSSSTTAFDAVGRVTDRFYAGGQSVDYLRAPSGVVLSVASSTGQRVTLERNDEGRVTRAVTSEGRSAEYNYDDEGRLVAVDVDGSPSTRYRLDPSGRIAEIVDAAGIVEVRLSYDSTGRVATQASPSGASYDFDYGDDNGVTTLRDLFTGEIFVYRHDELGRLVALEDPAGEVLRKTYNDAGNLIRLQERGGGVVDRTYDARGNLLTTTVADGGVTRSEYDAKDRLIRVTSPDGALTTYGYEADERLPSTVIDAEGGVTRYDVRGTVVEATTDPDGVSVDFTYDEHLRLVGAADALGRATRYGYDDRGNRTRLVSPSGATQTRTYDAAGRLTIETDASGATTRRTYDAAGRLLTVTDPTGAVTRSDYDALGRLVATTDALGHVTRRTYDERGLLATVEEPGGSTTTNEYTDVARLAKTTDPAGATTTYNYDSDGRRVETVDALGGRIRTTYDAAGRVGAQTDELGRTDRYTYDQGGRLLTETDAAGATTRYTYDRVGRQIDVETRTGGHVRRVLTAAGRLASEQKPSAGVERYAYDAAGQLVLRTSPGGAITRFGYDLDGRLNRVTTPEGAVTRATYDARGRLHALTAPNGGETFREYDLRGDLVRLTEPTGGVRSTVYDANRQLVRAVAAKGGVTRYDYDERGNLIRKITPDGETEAHIYDLADRRVTTTDPLGRVSRSEYDALGRTVLTLDGSGRSVLSKYDAAGQLVLETSGDGSARNHTYDVTGRRISTSDTRGTITYGYDADNRLTSKVHADGDRVSYTYDAAGRRNSMQRPDGSIDSYTYDDNGLLESLTSGGSEVRYSYNDDRQLVLEELPQGRSREYEWTDGLLTTMRQTASGSAAGVQIAYDSSGRRISTTRAGARTLHRYDASGQLIQSGSDQFEYDATGRRTSVTMPGGRTTYEYDAAGQLLSMSGSDRAVYTYDGAGRRITATTGGITTSTSYDAWGEPSSIESRKNGRVVDRTDLAYDAEGSLIEHISKSGRTRVSWDTARSIRQPMTLERDTEHINLAHGLNRAFATSGARTQVFDQDSLGSPVRTGDPLNLVRAQAYDAFGAPRDGGDSAALLFGYRGELSLGGGLLHLRARNYDTTTGAFTTTDPLPGVIGEAAGSNPYAYGHNDPHNRVDALGLRATSDTDINGCRPGQNGGGCADGSRLPPGFDNFAEFQAALQASWDRGDAEGERFRAGYAETLASVERMKTIEAEIRAIERRIAEIEKRITERRNAIQRIQSITGSIITGVFDCVSGAYIAEQNFGAAATVATATIPVAGWVVQGGVLLVGCAGGVAIGQKVGAIPPELG